MPEDTQFNLPTSPESFGVKLPVADLRRIDYTALEFDPIVRSTIEYIKTYYPTLFNDFVDNNGIIMLVDIIAYIGSTIAERGDVLVNESFLPTAFSEEAVSNHLSLINEALNLATPATVDIEASVASAVPTTINIPAGTTFNLTGSDGNSLTYEIYRAPNNWTDPISILPSKRGIIAFGIEGQFETPFEAISSGGPGQVINIDSDKNILGEPIFVDVVSTNIITRWNRISIIERSGPEDNVYEVVRAEGGIAIRFGDDKAGKSPLSGETIIVNYRTGGGIRGRIGSLRINETRPVQPLPPASASVTVTFRNNTPSIGGTDSESIVDAKKRAPKEASVLNAAVSGPDYAQLSVGYSHPVFGSILKAIATVRTSLNANIVEIYALAEGPDGPVKPGVGLKKGLKTYLEEVNVVTDEVRVLDGVIKRIDINANIVMNRNVDGSIIKSRVESAIIEFFNINNFDMGQELYLSDLYNIVQRIDGVKFATIFSPVDDILKTGTLAVLSETGVGENELIVLGETQLRFYFE